jgi:hypothetical protein
MGSTLPFLFNCLIKKSLTPLLSPQSASVIPLSAITATLSLIAISHLCSSFPNLIRTHKEKPEMGKENEAPLYFQKHRGNVFVAMAFLQATQNPLFPNQQ